MLLIPVGAGLYESVPLSRGGGGGLRGGVDWALQKGARKHLDKYSQRMSRPAGSVI